MESYYVRFELCIRVLIILLKLYQNNYVRKETYMYSAQDIFNAV
jgi:hypothetical protein